MSDGCKVMSCEYLDENDKCTHPGQVCIYREHAALEAEVARLKADLKTNAHMLAKLHDTTVPEADVKRLKAALQMIVDDCDLPSSEYSALERRAIAAARAALGKEPE